VSELPQYPRSASQREEAEGPPEAGPEVRYSGWWRRGAALVIDNVLVAVPALASLGLVALDEDAGFGVFALLWFVLPFFYFTYCHGKWGQTIGKRALGIRVRHAERDELIGYGAALGRYAITFAFAFFTVPVIVDYLFPLWDGRNQSLHDKVATSIVVRV
jgi:uncharacterized RDD family membrane protein YckC